ncbi:MAG: BrnT family toxin [Spirochaetaceae bacterium]|nr:MAG: BrnT family toxin [Spirochaetaceae bacterium]
MNVFEFDDAKSVSNVAKHGIDFWAAQELWNDPDLLEIEAKSEEELYER